MRKINCLDISMDEFIDWSIGAGALGLLIVAISIAKDHGAFSWIGDLLSLI